MALASATFTRPADTTAYAVGDLVANSTTAGSVVPLRFLPGNKGIGGKRHLTKCRLQKSGTGVTNASFKIHIIKASSVPSVANGDNSAFSLSAIATWVGSFDVSSMQAHADGAVGNGAPSVGNSICIDYSPGDEIYAFIEARGAYTPGSAEVFTCYLEDVYE